jgi:hypothetical protein
VVMVPFHEEGFGIIVKSWCLTASV